MILDAESSVRSDEPPEDSVTAPVPVWVGAEKLVTAATVPEKLAALEMVWELTVPEVMLPEPLTVKLENVIAELAPPLIVVVPLARPRVVVEAFAVPSD